jgi:glutaredoxin
LGSSLDELFESKQTRYKREQAALDAQERLREEERWQKSLDRPRAIQRNRQSGVDLRNNRVTLFVKSNCAECREVAQLLVNLGVPFTRKDTDLDKDARDELEQIWRRHPAKSKNLPLTIVGDHLVYGMDERKMVQALKRLRTPDSTKTSIETRKTELPSARQNIKQKPSAGSPEIAENSGGAVTPEIAENSGGAVTPEIPEDSGGAVSPPQAELP